MVVPPVALSIDLEKDLKSLNAVWPALVERIRKVHPVPGKYLLDARPAKVEAAALTLQFDPEYAGGMDSLDHPTMRNLLQKELQQLLGRSVSLHFEVAATPTPRDTPPDKSDLKAWTREPVVNRVLETFNGDIQDVRG